MALFESWQQERRAYRGMIVTSVHEPTHSPSPTSPEHETTFGTSRAGRKLQLCDQFGDLRVA